MPYSIFYYLRIRLNWRCTTAYMAKRLKSGDKNLPWELWYDWLDLNWTNAGYLWWSGRRKYRETLAGQLNEVAYVLRHSPEAYRARHDDVLQSLCHHFIWHDVEEAKGTLLKYAVEFVQRDPEHLFVFLQGYLGSHDVLRYLMRDNDLDAKQRRDLVARVYKALVTLDRRKVVEWLSLKERHEHMVAAVQALHMLDQELFCADSIPYPQEDENDDDYSVRIIQSFFPHKVCTYPLPNAVIFS